MFFVDLPGMALALTKWIQCVKLRPIPGDSTLLLLATRHERSLNHRTPGLRIECERRPSGSTSQCESVLLRKN